MAQNFRILSESLHKIKASGEITCINPRNIYSGFVGWKMFKNQQDFLWTAFLFHLWTLKTQHNGTAFQLMHDILITHVLLLFCECALHIDEWQCFAVMRDNSILEFLPWCTLYFLLQSRTPALVFEYVNNTDFKVSCFRPWLGNYNYYSYQLEFMKLSSKIKFKRNLRMS